MRKWFRLPEEGKAKTWVFYGTSEQGNLLESTASAGRKSEDAVPVAESGIEPVYHSGGNPEHRHLALS